MLAGWLLFRDGVVTALTDMLFLSSPLGIGCWSAVVICWHDMGIYCPIRSHLIPAPGAAYTQKGGRPSWVPIMVPPRHWVFSGDCGPLGRIRQRGENFGRCRGGDGEDGVSISFPILPYYVWFGTCLALPLDVAVRLYRSTGSQLVPRKKLQKHQLLAVSGVSETACTSLWPHPTPARWQHTHSELVVQHSPAPHRVYWLLRDTDRETGLGSLLVAKLEKNPTVCETPR